MSGKEKRKRLRSEIGRKRLVEFFRSTVFSLDLEAEYDRLKSFGKIDARKLRDRGAILHELNQAAENEHTAKRIYLAARRAYEEWVPELKRRRRPLKKAAAARVKEWLHDTGFGARKQITTEDVEEEMCAGGETREEYKKLVRRDAELREIVDKCKSLADSWHQRLFMLGKMASVVAEERKVFLGGEQKHKRR